MEPRHHISEEVLFSYAAGHTSHAFEVVLASHLTLCPVCRERMAQHEAIAGQLMEHEQPVAVNEDSLDCIFAQIAEAGPIAKAPKSRPSGRELSDVPGPLAQLLPHSDLKSLPWQSMVPGVKQFDLTPEGGSDQTLKLLKIAPGTTIPQHTHNGSELTLILHGSYTDEMGRFKRGDIATLDSEVSHQPIADSDEDCICLIAVDGNLKFKGLLPRLLQPIIGL
ncbi:ChrR family anti-sigma-E factor [Aestuariispira insulae]|uniref:ChrR-like anti-ECFsigma factor n=1 Tax=Aestuariispira insulae TaxID=1461337 RepID=A0A3D9H8I1_9PROT|nr:ChrR family anti-sigma-E factor [Aestuariispira insulae]RED45787.1 ChrR-like anti-ECFsigma factor [Aestuariispira insulae]